MPGSTVGVMYVCMQVIILVGAIPLAWNLAGAIIGYYGYTKDYEVRDSVA